MSGLVYVLLSVIVSILAATWILPKILSWHFERKFRIVFRIGRIGLPTLRLFDVHILKNGYTIHVDEISIRSSFFNSEVTKLITLVVRDVRIDKDIAHTPMGKRVDFRGKKIPHFITTFAQFMAVHVYNVSANFLKPDCLIHAIANELHLDGSIVQNARTLLVNVDLSEASVTIYRRAEQHQCLAEVNFAFITEATLLAHGQLSLEKLHIIVTQTNATLYKGFYGLTQGDDSDVVHSPSQLDDSIVDRLYPIIPKNFILKIEDTSLRGAKTDGSSDFDASLQILFLTYRTLNNNENFSNLLLNYKMCDLRLQNTQDKLLLLNNLAMDAKVEDNIVNLYGKLNTLLLTYDHEILYTWLRNNFLTGARKRTSVTPATFNPHHASLLNRFLTRYVINGCAEFCQLSALTRLSKHTPPSTFGFAHMKIILEQAKERRKNDLYKSYLPRLLLADRHWQTEILLESIFWTFIEQDSAVLYTKRAHVWRTPFQLGMALIKFGTLENVETKVESLLDTLQLEWSREFAEYVIMGVRCLKQYGSFEGSGMGMGMGGGKVGMMVSMHLALTHCNCFFQAENDNFVIRLNSITLEKNEQITNIQLRDTKLISVKNRTTPYNCIRTEDISDYLIYVKTAQMIKDDAKHELTVNLLEEVKLFWSTNFHLKMFYLWRDVREFFDGFKGMFSGGGSDEIETFNFLVYGVFMVHIRISAEHSARVSLDNLVYVLKEDDCRSVMCNLAVIAIDDADIFTIKGCNFYRIVDNQEIRDERADTENFNLPFNKTYGLTIDIFRAVFPYEHNYAQAIQNELISIVRWLKILHNRITTPFPANQPLPNDLLIKIREFLFELSDDPFEVKLRDNFELLVDEYSESLKRQKMLKEKIGELTKTHLHLPAGKVEELYASLKKRNAEIYVQRSKQMLLAGPQRTRLFAWSMTDVEVMVLVDPVIYGKENVVAIMREIDFASPWPEDDDIDFSILWCRVVSLNCKEWKFQLRDFPQPLLDIRKFYIGGTLVGAEQIAPKRAKRSVAVDLGEPFGEFPIERGMLPLKFYHDFNCEIESYSYAFGPCWEPVIAQCNLAFEKIFSPSRDPSPPLAFWDKMRLLLHGRLTMVVQQMTVLLHASLDPYNTTEEMELTWNQVILDWMNAKVVFKGDLNIFVRTASKYDDCQLLHLPNLKLVVGIKWVCLGDPNDHHAVIQCAPDKVPEYSSNQVHDSFRAFRSQNVNLNIVLETKPTNSTMEYPILVLYGSTLRWFENLKLILSGVTRPTRRGRIFNNVRPRKTQLSRHYKKLHLLMGLHKFQVCYWMSFAMQRGCELIGEKLSSSSEHTLSLIPLEDGLTHRPKAEWSIMYMNSELTNAEIWLKSALQEDPDIEEVCLRQPVEKCYCLSVAKVSYGREAALPTSERNKDTPTHRLVVYDLRGAWTKSNRNVAFALFDTFMKNKQMKKNLSTEALKGFRKEGSTTPLKRRNAEGAEAAASPNPAVHCLRSATTVQDSPSPSNKLQSGLAANMLQQLIAEAENKPIVYSDDLSSTTRQQQHLQGVKACQEDDVQYLNWLVALVNAQVLLKGCETKGYVILSAAKAEIRQRIHRPVWKDRTLVSKTTWTGRLECMQYYATVNAGESDSANENIMWLTVDNIQERDEAEISEPAEVPNMVGSGVSVGAVVSDTVGASNASQLQRIVSRCKCEFFYASYGDISVDPAAIGDVPPPPQEDASPWENRQTAVDAFTLMHYDLNVCTNSLQYAMLLDIVNNLLLYVDPKRKKALERLARMRFQLQLHSVEDQRRPIQNQQTLVRSTVSKLRRLEKDMHLVSKALAEDPNDMDLMKEMERLELQVYECKNLLNALSEELDMMLSCYKESQLLATSRLATTRSNKPITVVRSNEIYFKQGQWRLTEADGQIGIADLLLSNFLYTKTSKSDDSVEHLLELGYLRINNLLPNEIYKKALCPTEIQFNMPVEHKRVVRIFCREKPPVGGISVKEHFEINVVPLTIGLTKKFYNTMMKFCFPERDPDMIEETEEADNKSKKSKSSSKRNRDSNFYVNIERNQIDDVEKMKERAEKNKLFVYIKIPELPVRVSYKGNKEKNLEDLRDISLTIPTLEYHNMTWTWLDLLMAIRSDTRRVILSQAIKQKLQIKRNTGSLDERASPQEEDKARMLFGNRHGSENRSLKKGVSSVFRFPK